MIYKSLFIPISVIILVAWTLTGCVPENNDPESETMSENSKVNKMKVEILSAKGEKDGYTLKLKNEDGEILEGVISIPNLGPDSTFDFDEIKPGNTIIVSGDLWMMGKRPQLTIFEASSAE